VRRQMTRTGNVRGGVSRTLVEALEERRLLAFTALVDFQPAGVHTQSGYKADAGAVFGSRGNGLTYGWNETNNNGVDRNSKQSFNQAYDTFLHMQKNGNFSWELAVPNGSYDVRIIAGDAVFNSGDFYHILAEGQTAINGRQTLTYQHWLGSNQPITVTDGRLTISNGANAVNNKIALIEVRERPPAAPNTLVVTAVGPRQIKLTWKDNSATEQGFAVERTVSGTGSSNYQTVATLAANSTGFSDTTASPGTTYGYRIRAFNDIGSSYSSVQFATTPSDAALAPAAPSNLTLVGLSGTFATISWADNSDNEEKFLIQVGWNGTAFTTRKEVPANTTSTTVYLSSAAVQDLRVVARNTAGGNSAPTNVVTIATKPEAPVYVGAQAAHDSPTTAVDVFWDSLDSCQFHVERFNPQTNAWDRIASDVISLSYRDTGLEPGTSYSYRIIAVAANSAGDSEPSDVATATTAPRAVTGLAVTGVTANSVSLSWNDVVGEGSYRVERSLDGVNWTAVTLLYADTTSYTATGLQSNTTYYFRVTGLANGSQFPGESAEPVIARTR
jgi:fibronectin type 3 domain-containing protein